jgi:Cdc6-like AAA superfamily ATPase
LLEEGEVTMEMGQIDQPISKDKGIKGDELKIDKYITILTEFIIGTNTPITIGVQGEWGSGKTSLLNMIWSNLAEKSKKDVRIEQIWINAWEHSLRRDAPETLLRIVQDICEQVMKLSCDLTFEHAEKLQEARKKKEETFMFNGESFITEDEVAKHKLATTDKVRKNIFKWGKTMTKVAVAAVPGIDAKSAYSVLEDECNESNTDDGIRQLRDSLDELLDSKDGTKYVVYIDDLDRINPTHAVDVLELLKNIFDLENCIFVLAIDYQVVVKGLKDKFGSKSVDNEWEFRSFFDKIIQLPFFMPMEKYAVGSYVRAKLSQVGFIIPEDDGKTEENESVCDGVIKNTTTSNPRSIIRLVNSVKLIEMIHEHDNAPTLTDQHRLLLFALVSIQIAYPDIYDLLLKEPNFIEWDHHLVTEYYASKAIKQDEDQIELDLERLGSALVEFDEEWEKSLYRICHAKPRYKARSICVSRVLNIIRNVIIRDSIKIEDEMRKVLQLTAVTNVQTSEVTVNINENDWAGGTEGRQQRVKFWKYLAKFWAGKDVPDGEKVYLPKEDAEESIFWFKNPRTSNLLRPEVGTRFDLGKNDCQLYLAPSTCEFEIRIGKDANNLFEWFKDDHHKAEFCNKLNTKLKYEENPDKEITLNFKITGGRNKNQVKLTSKFLEELWNRFEGKGTEISSEELWPEYCATITEIAPHFEDVTLKELKRFKEEGMA